MKSITIQMLFVLFTLHLISCGNDEEPDPTPIDYSTSIADLANNVIVATYAELDQNAEALITAVENLADHLSAQNLEAAQQAWIDTRSPWEKSEGFLFGPVDTDGLDPALDSWPVNRTDLESVLSSSDVLSVDFVNNLEGTLKGFHTIEFLLWGADGNKSIDDFTDREFEYLQTTSTILAQDANKLIAAWEASNGNFVANLLTAGTSGSIYISQKSVLEELANGILGIADEVGNGKINDPLEQEDVSLEESQFSNNSKRDFTDNIISIRNIYQGLNGFGLADVVEVHDSALSVQIVAEIQAAIDAIQAIPGTFTEAIPANSPSRAAAEAAQQKVRDLQGTFEAELIPLISGL